MSIFIFLMPQIHQLKRIENYLTYYRKKQILNTKLTLLKKNRINIYILEFKIIYIFNCASTFQQKT